MIWMWNWVRRAERSGMGQDQTLDTGQQTWAV